LRDYTFLISQNIIELKEDTKSIIDTLDRFFLICKISDFDFIKIEDVISKCAFKTQWWIFY